MEIDLLVVHPDNCDYPLFRKFLFKNRSRFNRVFIAITKSNRPEKTDFIKKHIKPLGVTFIESDTPPGRDWRDHATNEMLKQSESEYVLFMEQDFLISEDQLDKILTKNFQCVGFYEGDDRLHPAFLLTSRLNINLTCRDFGAKPPEYDHFFLIQRDLHRNGVSISSLDNMNIEYKHMAGLSHNLSLLQDNKKVTYKPDELLSYFNECEKCGVELPMDFFRSKSLLESQLENTI